jgi:hypothetical protein
MRTRGATPPVNIYATELDVLNVLDGLEGAATVAFVVEVI